MENNEISMCMDVKLDIHDKRTDFIKYNTWTKCQVKIEAIKCLPCFLRITFERCDGSDDDGALSADADEKRSLRISIVVPGVNISLTASRTKLYSYGLFWTQNRKNCHVYFALETEANCRRHMKWMRKSIKNLELHRKLLLEQCKISRHPQTDNEEGGVVPAVEPVTTKATNGECHKSKQKELNTLKTTLGPLPKTPETSSWSRRVSRASEIYEEIFEASHNYSDATPRLSRRLSRSSIASGIYEEMKPTAGFFNAIVEEVFEPPPPLPPLPPPRKRINTFETECGLLGAIPRSNTNPESEMAKKKKYKNMLDNIFGSGRAKRAESVSETQACTADELISESPKTYAAFGKSPTYVNDEIAAKRQKKPTTPLSAIDIAKSKRNSFSSPDLSKINFLDTFDEEKVADLLLQDSFSVSDDLNVCNYSFNESSSIMKTGEAEDLLDQSPIVACKAKAKPLESLNNVSQQIPNNFNFSACNSSTINLIGANGAALSLQSAQKKNKILVDDLTGYCVMAPIVKKKNNGEHTSSGYSSGSPSYTNSTEEHLRNQPSPAMPHNITDVVQLQKQTAANKEDSAIYVNMMGSLNSTKSSISNGERDSKVLSGAVMDTPPPCDFTGNLYENLLTIKAAQELEQQQNPTPPLVTSGALSTSTPTESPLAQLTSDLLPIEEGIVGGGEEESFYQTPRKSIISVDDKIPSYYPNSCDTMKIRRTVQSPLKVTTPTSSLNEKSTSSIGLRQLVSMKIRRERKENMYISSPQQIIEQRYNTKSSNDFPSTTSTASNKSSIKSHKTKKTAAHKISENVYAVKHAIKRSSNSNKIQTANGTMSAGLTDEMKEKLQTELLQLAVLQKIDFKFDDGSSSNSCSVPTVKVTTNNSTTIAKEQQTIEAEFETTSRLMHHSYGNIVAATTHHLQQNQAFNTNRNSPASVDVILQSSKMISNNHELASCATTATVLGDVNVNVGSVKKSASLPRFKKFDFSPLKLKINNVLQRNQQNNEF